MQCVFFPPKIVCCNIFCERDQMQDVILLYFWSIKIFLICSSVFLKQFVGVIQWLTFFVSDVSNSQALDYFYQDMSKWHWSELQQKPKESLTRSRKLSIFQGRNNFIDDHRVNIKLSSKPVQSWAVNYLHLLLVTISSTFYEQLLHMKIPEAQKRLTIWLYFLCFWDLCMKKLCIKW